MNLVAIFAKVSSFKIIVMKRLLLFLVLLTSTAIAVKSTESLQWKYDSASDTYYIVGIVYCDNPADESYEQMGIYVPGAYMNATSNGGSTYTCTINSNGKKKRIYSNYCTYRDTC